MLNQPKTELRASIDLGTNTCLLLIAEVDVVSRVVTRVIEDRATVVKLGQGVDQTAQLHPDAISRTKECLSRYAELMTKYKLNLHEAKCVATSQARDAKNGSLFFDDIKKTWGLKFLIISGDEEARLAFIGGVPAGENPDDWAVLDIGGGSTELTGDGKGMSLNLGSVRFTERYLKTDPVSDSDFWACQAAIDTLIENWNVMKANWKAPKKLVGVAGTVTTLAHLFLDLKEFDSKKIDQVVLSRGDVHRLVEDLKWRNVSERAALLGSEANRADVILAGALILWRVLEVLDFQEIRVSTRGLRYGVITQN